MIWIISAILSTLMIGLSFKLYFDKRKDSLCIFAVLLFLFAATFLSYLPVFLESYDFFSSLIGSFINVLHIIAIDSDFMQAYTIVAKGISDPVLTNLYMAMLGLLNIAMPAVSALTAVTVLLRYFSSAKLFIANKHKRPFYVFSEVNERSLELAQSLSDSRCDIVFSNSDDSTLIENSGDRKHEYIFKEEKITELKIQARKNRDIYYFCISENEDEALGYALQLIDNASKADEQTQAHIHISLFSKIADYSVYLDSAQKGLLDIQCINESETIIYNLLYQYPLYKFANPGINILLYGLSPVNMAALKAASWCGQLSGFQMKISVVGIHMEDEIHKLKVSAPGLFSDRYNITFYNCANQLEAGEEIIRHCPDSNYVIVSEATDHETIEAGIFLRRLLYRADNTFRNCPPIFCCIKDPSKSKLVKNLATAEANPKKKMSYHLTPFGSLTEIYDYKRLVGSDLEGIAKNVHLAYEEIFSDGELNVNEALKRYNAFEVNKRSNRASALHIKYKLNLLGLDYTSDENAEPVDFLSFCNEDTLEQFAISEHNRWAAFLESEGWITASEEEVDAYRASGISKGRHNCPLLKMHPYICEYEKLKALSMDLEGKDTTVYDKELILRIPDILADKWNVSGKKNKIIRIKK